VRDGACTVARMENVATVRFKDVDADDEALAIVRARVGAVAVALSLQQDGDLEVVLPVDAARELRRALDAALAVADR
jgi:hypothetical protein